MSPNHSQIKPTSRHSCYNQRVMELLQGLNIQQQQAVSAGTGPVLVLAGPGSGKTRVLTHRVAYLIGYMGVRPYGILTVTFTNKAAREMNQRVETLLGGQTRGLTVGTFHAFCARLLRREAEYLPIGSNFVIFDADDQLGLVKQALKDLNLDEKRYRPHALHAAISNAKNELYGPDEFPVQNYRDEVTRRVYQTYQGLLLTNNAVDFDDLLLYTAHLLEMHPTVRDRYARRFEHILVDEFQDTNMAQYTLLRHLASFHNNLFVVGDADQSIYRWRGADYRNVLRFEKDYPDAQVILLEQNYRSTQTILDVAMAVIDKNPHRTPKKLFTERGRGKSVVLKETSSDREEAQYVIETIADLIARKQASPGDFAVMYRTNAQSRVLEEAFLKAGLPYKIVGAQRFYGRREIKDLIAYLRLVHNPNDEVSLMRVINTPRRGIGAKTIQALRTQAQKAGLSMGEAVLALAHTDDSPLAETFSNQALSALKTFGILLAGWRAADLSPLELLDRITNDIEYRPYIDDGSDEGYSRWENVLELRRLAAEQSENSLETFLEQIALVADQDTLDEQSHAPTLLTLHAAKGLEFPIVFLVGLNDGVLPHSRSFDDPEAMMEERRLLYVGITRAKNHLHLTYAQQRYTYGYPEYAEPSRFLADIPTTLLDDGKPQGKTSKRTPRGALQTRWESAPPQSKAVSRYQVGQRVIHPKFGEGLVLNTRMDDEDEILDVFFEDAGLKRLVAALANLKTP